MATGSIDHIRWRHWTVVPIRITYPLLLLYAVTSTWYITTELYSAPLFQLSQWVQSPDRVSTTSFLNKVKYCRNNKWLQFTIYTLTWRDFYWRLTKNTLTSFEVIVFVSSFYEIVSQFELIIYSHRGMTKTSPLLQHCCQIMTKISRYCQ